MDNVDDHIQCGLLHNILLINYANISLPIMFMWCAYVKKQLDMKGCQLIDVMKLDPFLLIFDTWWQTMRNHLFFLPKHNKCFLITKNKTLGLENCVAQGILYSSCYNRHKCQLHGTGWQCIHLVEHVLLTPHFWCIPHIVGAKKMFTKEFDILNEDIIFKRRSKVA